MMVDILIPTYQRPAALAVTLTILCAQSYRDFRVVISDQSEEADPLESGEVQAVLRVLRLHGHEVRTHKHLPRRGMADDRQFLLDQAAAPYALFLDDDLLFESEVVGRMHAANVNWIRCPPARAWERGAFHVPGSEPGSAADPNEVDEESLVHNTEPGRPPRVSVLMPTFDHELFIRPAISSLLSQSWTDWELIIVEDGSPDNTAAVVAPFLTDSRIRYQRLARDRGLGAASNVALEQARADLIAYLPSDDVYHADHRPQHGRSDRRRVAPTRAGAAPAHRRPLGRALGVGDGRPGAHGRLAGFAVPWSCPTIRARCTGRVRSVRGAWAFTGASTSSTVAPCCEPATGRTPPGACTVRPAAPTARKHAAAMTSPLAPRSRLRMCRPRLWNSWKQE